ncbi:MAG: MFS transporter [Clostridia bacterium]|jgi:hypothetical protein|nr:MFS transporter [Clostridia bacterium]
MNNKKSKICKSAKLLMSSDLIYTLTSLFVKTFLVAYFLKVTNDSIIQISIYYIIMYTLSGIGKVLIGKVVKSNPEYRTKVLSMGIVLRAVFILFIVILKENIATYFPIVAILYGISEVFYWTSHEVLYIDVTTNENRKDYMSIKTILGKIINIIAPIILGSSIELYSFTKIAIYIFILSVIQIIISLQIKTDKNETLITNKYSIKTFLENLNNSQKIKINKYTKSAIAYGVIESSMQTLVVIITIMTFKTSFNLGILTSVFSICSMIAMYLYKNFYNRNNSKFVLYLCSSLIVIGVIGLVFDINKITLVIYNFVYTISICILGVIYDTKKGDLVKECNIEEWKVEWVSYVVLFMHLGRISGYILMLITGLFNNIIVFKILLILVTLFAPICTKLMYGVEKI